MCDTCDINVYDTRAKENTSFVRPTFAVNMALEPGKLLKSSVNASTCSKADEANSRQLKEDSNSCRARRQKSARKVVK